MIREEAGVDRPPSLAEIREAEERIADQIRTTPLEHSRGLSDLVQTEVLLKCECIQRTGSFKLRGALNALLDQGSSSSSGGVVTASAGNHGLGTAFAARLIGIPAVVFVPAGAPSVKQRRIAALGAEVRRVEGDYDAAHLEAVRYAEEAGVRYLHAYSDPAVVAGQGTVGLEIESQIPIVGTIVIPVGGGGLLGGVGAAIRGLGLSTRIIGVQSEATSAMHASLVAGRPTSVPATTTLCDGLAGDVDDATLALARTFADEVLLVSEAAVGAAIRSHYLDDGLTVEGSGAVGAAALRSGLLDDTPGPVVVIVTGGNIDATRLAGILDDQAEQK